MQPSGFGGMPAPPPPPVRKGSGQWLSAAAVALAVVAIAIAVVVPGPAGTAGRDGSPGATGATGAPGPAGPQGPSGPGTLMTTSASSATTTMGVACTNYLSVTITVPSTGTVLVQTQAWIRIDHTAGTRDLANLLTASAPDSCGLSPSTTPVDVPANAPTASVFYGVFQQQAFPVSPGTHTYYFNGRMTVGGDANDAFFYANMAAVFYPG